MQELQGKIAFVTGSSRGIGGAAGLRLAAKGATVIFHGSAESGKLNSVIQDWKTLIRQNICGCSIPM